MIKFLTLMLFLAKLCLWVLVLILTGDLLRGELDIHTAPFLAVGIITLAVRILYGRVRARLDQIERDIESIKRDMEKRQTLNRLADRRPAREGRVV